MVRTRLDFWHQNNVFYSGNEVAQYKRPKIECNIRKWKYDEWKIFSKYHYLDANLSKAAHRYILEYEWEPIWFCAVIHFPHPKNAKIKKVHRLVIRPDYQWLWIWIKFLEKVWTFYNDFDYTITTSNQALIYGLKNKSNWICKNYWKQTFSKSDKLWANLNRKIATFKLINNND